MRAAQIAMVFAVSVIIATVFGCAAMTPSGPTPEEEARSALMAYQAAWEAQDMDKIMSAFSDDDYSNPSGMDKAAVRTFLEGLAAQGVLQTVKVNLEECEIIADGDSVTATPVIYDSPTATGKTTYRYTLKKESDGIWRIVIDEQIY